jgi:hypothetical protein
MKLYGEVWKHARLTDDQYAETEFIAEYPREGGIILDAVRKGADAILDSIAEAIAPVYTAAIEQGINEHEEIAQQHQERLTYVKAMHRNTATFDQLLEAPPGNWADAYSKRSIIKEIDQLVNQVSPERLEGSTVDLTLIGTRPHLPFQFDGTRAKRFHNLASRRELAAPVIVKAIIRSLDRGNRYTKPNAKILNTTTNKEVVLRLQSIDDFETLHAHHNGQSVELFTCPIVEAFGFDVQGGDLMFIAVV